MNSLENNNYLVSQTLFKSRSIRDFSATALRDLRDFTELNYFTKLQPIWYPQRGCHPYKI